MSKRESARWKSDGLHQVRHQPERLVRQSLHYQAVLVELPGHIPDSQDTLHLSEPQGRVLRPKGRQLEVGVTRLATSSRRRRRSRRQESSVAVIHVQTGSPV
jgi:hypothetical protein